MAFDAFHAERCLREYMNSEMCALKEKLRTVFNKNFRVFHSFIQHLLNIYYVSNFTRHAINIKANEVWFLTFIELKVGIHIYQE